MPAIDWIKFDELAVARGHPTLTDVVNRPLRQLLINSGIDPDSGAIKLADGSRAPLIDIRNYGGSPSASGAVNAVALASASAAAAPVFGSVYIPAGNWDLDAFPSPWPVITGIVGDGIDATILLFTPTSGNALTVSGATNGIKHLFAGFTLAPKTTCSGNGMSVQQFKFCVMDRVRIRNFQVGLAITDSYYTSVRNCTFDHCTQDGVNLDLDSNALSFFNCSFSNNARAGAYVYGGRAVAFHGGCAFESNAQGLYVVADTARNTAGVSASGCYFEGNTVQDVWIKSVNAGVTKPKNTVIRDSYFQPLTLNTTDAIRVDEHDGVLIEGNTFDNLSGFAYSHSVFQTAAGSGDTRMLENVDKSTNGPLATAGTILMDGQFSGDLTAPGGFRTPVSGWYQTNIPAAQAALEATRGDGRFLAPSPGSVLGIQVALDPSQARSAGTLTAEVWVATINPTTGARTEVATGLTAVIDGTNPVKKLTLQAKDLDLFTNGDEIYPKFTTDGSWAPTTADPRCTIFVEC